MTTEELVEAVARAICRDDGYDPDGYPGGRTDLRPRWMGYDENARAALAAVAKAAGLDAEVLRDAADSLQAWPDHMTRTSDAPVAALLRALAGAADG